MLNKQLGNFSENYLVLEASSHPSMAFFCRMEDKYPAYIFLNSQFFQASFITYDSNTFLVCLTDVNVKQWYPNLLILIFAKMIQLLQKSKNIDSLGGNTCAICFFCS